MTDEERDLDTARNKALCTVCNEMEETTAARWCLKYRAIVVNMCGCLPWMWRKKHLGVDIPGDRTPPVEVNRVDKITEQEANVAVRVGAVRAALRNRCMRQSQS